VLKQVQHDSGEEKVYGMSDKLTNFHERIMKISPQYIDIFGTGLTGMTGGAAAIGGASNSGTDLTQALQIVTMKFVRSYHSKTTQTAELMKSAKKIEGLILSLQTLSALTAKEAGTLINELYDVIDERK